MLYRAQQAAELTRQCFFAIRSLGSHRLCAGPHHQLVCGLGALVTAQQGQVFRRVLSAGACGWVGKYLVTL